MRGICAAGQEAPAAAVGGEDELVLGAGEHQKGRVTARVAGAAARLAEAAAAVGHSWAQPVGTAAVATPGQVRAGVATAAAAAATAAAGKAAVAQTAAWSETRLP